MQKFIGVKVIQAKEMTRQAYNDYRGWELPADEDGSDPGYLVEYLDGGQANHPGHNGYISWSPAGVFERAYRPTNGMTFSQVIEALKKGHQARFSFWPEGVKVALHKPQKESKLTQPYFYVISSCGNFPWTPTQIEILSDQWIIIQEPTHA